MRRAPGVDEPSGSSSRCASHASRFRSACGLLRSVAPGRASIRAADGSTSPHLPLRVRGIERVDHAILAERAYALCADHLLARAAQVPRLCDRDIRLVHQHAALLDRALRASPHRLDIHLAPRSGWFRRPNGASWQRQAVSSLRRSYPSGACRLRRAPPPSGGDRPRQPGSAETTRSATSASFRTRPASSHSIHSR